MVWPDLEAPSLYQNPYPEWEDPALPDIRIIWNAAKIDGYAVGVHGSLKRDFDIIAVPWTEAAKSAEKLISTLCEVLNAVQVGGVEQKPHGRIAVTLQIDGYFKPIDLSIMPLGDNHPVHGTAENRRP